MKTNQPYEIMSAEDFSQLQRALSAFAGSAEYKALLSHYELARQTTDDPQRLLLIKLFQEALESLLQRRALPVSEAISQIRSDLVKSVARLEGTHAMLHGEARPVAKIMHFVWVGGSEVGFNQRDYMNIWRQVLEPQGYRFNLWYDSDALLAFEMNRVILDSARVDALESGGDKVSKAFQLSQMIEDRARVLKQQMFAHLQQPQWQGRADEARIDLMVRAYGKDRMTLEAFRQRCLQTHQAMVGTDLQLRDVGHEFAGHFLQDVYQREVAMRGNFAAASDVVRLQVEYLEGGRYSDMDYLPPLADTLAGVDILSVGEEGRIGVLQLLLNHNEALMPGRDRQRYLDRTDKIPAEHLEALTAFAREQHPPSEIFVAPQDHAVPRDALRLGTAYGLPDWAEMNAHMLAHPGSAMTLAYMQMIRLNYDCLLEVERRAAVAGIDPADQARMFDVVENVVNAAQAQGKLPEAQSDVFRSRLIDAIFTYYRDGIRLEARGTITLTGPGAAAAALLKYIEQHLQPDRQVQIRQHLKLLEGYNTHTEEEMISGWTVDGKAEQWLLEEREKWRTGKLKSRYAGQLADLLKPHTLIFKQGWPVIEGKPVLLTPVLQQLMDDLGEPFMRAMREKLSGEITFNSAISISLDNRELIRAQTVSEIPFSHGAEATGNLNELFTLVDHGSMVVEQLSPLQRVILGAMFGAKSLDAAGFAPAWQSIIDVARETSEGGLFARYHAIEKALIGHASPAFKAGLAAANNHGTHMARELKALAMSESLTLKHWGERIGQINRTAQREYHTHIFKRSGQVRDAFFQAGAVSVRQLPQDLLLRTPGDPGRRCYPLALLMGAAVAAGELAERALIGRVANASLRPDDVDSRALLSALDELGGVPERAIGQARGRQSLDSVMQTLEAKTAPGVLLLDTGNHALLVAKVQVAGQTLYRFYDPNFALYGFAGYAQLKVGVERYLRDDDTLARLYGLADIGSAQFDVIELDTVALAERTLSSGLHVESFLQTAAIADPQAASVWAKQAVARTCSLSENARLGASLAQLDARYWAQEFDHATRQLRAEHTLGRNYLPLLDTVKANSDTGYSLTLVDVQNPGRSLTVGTADARFDRLKKHLQRLVGALAGKPSAAVEADGGSRLSFAFAIQTLITEMRHRDYQADGERAPVLSIALQVQVYFSYAQLGFGVLSDTAQTINLVRQVAASERALALGQSSLSGRLLGRAATAGGFVFSLANIGFDLHNLSVAENHEQRSRFSTSLAFNVAALGLDVVALAAGGAVGTAGALLSVPLLGVGIGVTAIASNLGQIRDKATAVGNHLRAICHAYRRGAYTLKGGVLQFPAEAVIVSLNLQTNEVRFDSQKFYPWTGGSLELPQYNDDPKDLHLSLDIRQALGLPEIVHLYRDETDALETLVLPCTPICHYGYEYQLKGLGGYTYEPIPGEAGDAGDMSGQTRYPQVTDRMADALEYDQHGNRRFYLTTTPSLPHILYKLHPVYQPTDIRLVLDSQVRQLVVPTLEALVHKKISYAIRAPEGQYRIRLVPGIVSVKFQGPATWIVHAAWASLAQVSFAASLREHDDEVQLIVDGMALSVFDGLIELAEGMFRVDGWERCLRLQSVTLDDQNRLPSVLAMLRKHADEGRLVASVVPLYKFRVPAAPKVMTTAWYDAIRNRLLYARNLPGAVNEGLVLGGASNRHAWFYHPQHATVWRVDAITGTVVHRYRLMNPASGSHIIGCALDADGSLRILQRLLLDARISETETTLEYRVSDSAVALTGIKSSFTEEPTVRAGQGDLHHFTNFGAYNDETSGMADVISTWAYAPFVYARTYYFEGLRQRAWVNKRTGQYFSAGLGSEADMVMLMPADPESGALLFYSKQAQTISRGVEPKVGRFINFVIERDIVEVTQTAGSYIATKADGRLFEIDIHDLFLEDKQWIGQPLRRSILKFVGLGQHWLKLNPDWLDALSALAKAYKNEPFPIIGLGARSGNAFLAAWCVDDRLVLTALGQEGQSTLLGMTPDTHAAWLLDGLTAKLYRQPTIAVESLRVAFAAGAQWLRPESLPKPERPWPHWSFAQVLKHGQGLLGQTRDGVNVELRDQQAARIISVENRWSCVQGETAEQLRRRLKALLARHAHAPFLPVENTGTRYTYYIPAQDRLFDVVGRDDGQWPTFLGMRNNIAALMFDPVEGRVFSTDSAGLQSVSIPDCHAQREGDVLSLALSDGVVEVTALLPDGVDTLILAFESRTAGYRITEQAWQRLDCIVVDTQLADNAEGAGSNLLLLEMADCARLLMSLVDGHLMFTDPDSAHTLIVRDVDPPYSERRKHMVLEVSVDTQVFRFTLEQWIAIFSRMRGDEAIVELLTVIKVLS
jgi:insecticidal toxin